MSVFYMLKSGMGRNKLSVYLKLNTEMDVGANSKFLNFCFWEELFLKLLFHDQLLQNT